MGLAKFGYCRQAPANHELGVDEHRRQHPRRLGSAVWAVRADLCSPVQKEQNVSTASLRELTGTIVMHRGISLAGSVVDADGRAVPEAIVIWGDDPYYHEGSQELRTDLNGHFRLPPLAPGAMTVTVVAPGWAPDQKKLHLAPGTSPLSFQLAAGRTLRIRFVDRSGTAVPNVGVGISRWREGMALYNHDHPNVLDSRLPSRIRG